MTSSASDTLTHLAIPEPLPVLPPRPSRPPNVGEIERTASVLLGSLLLVSGLKRFSITGLGLAYVGFRLVKRGATGQCAVYKALHVAPRESGDSIFGSNTFTHPLHQHIRVEKSVTINKPADEIFKFWRNFENLPRFMEHLQAVKVIDEKHSHWVTKAPRGDSVEWDATVVEEIANQKIAWKSASDARVPNSGQVLFNPASQGGGTEVKVVLAYDPPAGIFGAMFAKLFGEDPAKQVQDDLARFKRLMESNDSAGTAGSE